MCKEIYIVKMKIITDVEERVVENNSRIILLPLARFERDIWQMRNQKEDQKYTWMYSYKVHKDNKPKAVELSKKLYALLSDGEKITGRKVTHILARLKDMRLLSWSELSDLDKWEKTAASLPGDIAGRYKKETTHFISEKLSGDVLEAMCGFNSYIYPHIDRLITAHDYSEKMLKRYEYPKRRRVQFDLNLLPKKRFAFREESFDAILFVKGYKYIKSPVAMFREWKRLLKPDGKLFFIESTTAGYSEMTLRRLRVKECKQELQQAGFHDPVVRCLPFDEGDGEELLLFEVRK